MTDQPDQPRMSDEQRERMEQVDQVDVAVSYKRPGVLTFIGIVLFIQAAMAAVNAFTLWWNSDDAAYQQANALTENELLTAAGIEAVFAIAFFAVGWGIMTGWKWSRFAVALVYGVRLAISGWYILTTLGQGVHTNALVQVGVAIFVLWALYGHDKSDRYFEGIETPFGGQAGKTYETPGR